MYLRSFGEDDVAGPRLMPRVDVHQYNGTCPLGGHEPDDTVDVPVEGAELGQGCGNLRTAEVQSPRGVGLGRGRSPSVPLLK